jgi:predicted AAA+ superfamily ATPase
MQKQVIRKKYLEFLESFKDDTRFVKIITGVRRCGKSTLMLQFMERLRSAGMENILYVNFEDMRFSEIGTYKDLNQYIRSNIDPKVHTYVFFDEVQRVKEWERSINGLMVGYDADIYITGSNSFVLSSELSTYLTGRYVSVNMFPLSFSEYVELHSDGRDVGLLFELYMRYGAFPAIDPFGEDRAVRTVLSDLYAAIVYRDIMSRGQIRDQADLDKVTKFLMINIGNPVSANSIAGSIGNIRRETVERYLGLLEGSYIIYRADRFDIKSTALAPTPKYYTVDTGLRNAPLGYRDEDLGRLLENIVYLELLRRGFTVQVGRYGDSEIDFVVRKPDGNTEYIQVAQSIRSENTRDRELRPLRALGNSFPKTVITTDQRLASTTEDGIRHVHAIEWLLGNAG